MLLKISFFLSIFHLLGGQPSIITSNYHVFLHSVEFTETENAFEEIDCIFLFLLSPQNVYHKLDPDQYIKSNKNIAVMEDIKIKYEEAKQKIKVIGMLENTDRKPNCFQSIIKRRLEATKKPTLIGMLENTNRKPIPNNQFQNCSQTNILTFILGSHCWVNFSFFKESLKSNHSVIKIEPEKYPTPVTIKQKSLNDLIKNNVSHQLDEVGKAWHFDQYMQDMDVLIIYLKEIILHINSLVEMYEDIVESSKNGKPSKHIFPTSVHKIPFSNIDDFEVLICLYTKISFFVKLLFMTSFITGIFGS